MRVLMLTQVVVYPADAGPKVKTLQVLRHLLDEERIDVLHVDQLNMMRFVPPDWHGTVILDEHNAVWQVVERLRKGASNPFARWLLGREVRLMRNIEGEACRRAQVVLAV